MTVAENEITETKKSCVNCENLFDCGTINRWLTDYSKIELLKQINKSDEKLCPNFSFIAISGEILKRKIDRLVEISKHRKEELKRTKNKV